MAAGHAAGALVVVLDRALADLPIARDGVGRALTVRVSAAGQDPVRTGTTIAVTPAGRGLRPPSPVHLRARRQPDGAVLLTWTRRTRIGGDVWAAEVPLGEEAERYRAEILDGTTVRRTFEPAAPRATYAFADQIADFSAPPATIRLRVAQIAPGTGAGTAREAVLDV